MVPGPERRLEWPEGTQPRQGAQRGRGLGCMGLQVTGQRVGVGFVLSVMERHQAEEKHHRICVPERPP